MRTAKSKVQKVIVKTDAVFYAQVRDVFVQARQFVHKTANFAMVKAYWLVGKMIVEKQGGEGGADWRTDPKRSGGSLCGGDIGTHALMQLRFVTDLDVTRVSAHLENFIVQNRS